MGWRKIVCERRKKMQKGRVAKKRKNLNTAKRKEGRRGKEKKTQPDHLI